MTWKSRAAAAFPVMLIGLAGWSIVSFLLRPTFVSFADVAFVIYLFPVAIHRITVFLYPLEPGLSNLAERRFSPWWASHQIQLMYAAFPGLEALLRMIPGAYSAWLRLWGARIGRNVYWTPRMEIHDRGLLDLGDGVVFGHKVELYGHTVMPKRSRMLLYVAPIRVGSGAFVGAGSRLAPGVVVEDGAVVPILTDLYMNARYKKEEPGVRPVGAPRPA